MKTDDITLQVLISIRDEIRNTNARLDETNARLDDTNARIERSIGSLRMELCERIDAQRIELGERIADTNLSIGALSMRVGTMDHRLSTQISHLTQELRAQRTLDKRVAKCERDIATLKRRTS